MGLKINNRPNHTCAYIELTIGSSHVWEAICGFPRSGESRPVRYAKVAMFELVAAIMEISD